MLFHFLGGVLYLKTYILSLILVLILVTLCSHQTFKLIVQTVGKG